MKNHAVTEALDSYEDQIREMRNKQKALRNCQSDTLGTTGDDGYLTLIVVLNHGSFFQAEMVRWHCSPNPWMPRRIV